MVFTLLGNVTVVRRLLLALNAYSPILVTPLGMLTDTILSHPLNMLDKMVDGSFRTNLQSKTPVEDGVYLPLWLSMSEIFKAVPLNSMRNNRKYYITPIDECFITSVISKFFNVFCHNFKIILLSLII